MNVQYADGFIMTPSEKKQLRSKAHSLKPVVMIGQAGITDAVLAEIDLALEHHELIKVRISTSDRDSRKQHIVDICSHTGSECIQSIGQIAALYRENPNKH
jgi:RNA-binding protein